MGFLVCWMPYAVFSVLYAFGDDKQVPIEATTIPALMAKASSFLNPIIYMVASRKYRAMLTACICRRDVSAMDRTPAPLAIQNAQDRNILTPNSATGLRVGLTSTLTPPQARNPLQVRDPQVIFVVEHGSNLGNTSFRQNGSSSAWIGSRSPPRLPSVHSHGVSGFHNI